MLYSLIYILNQNYQNPNFGHKISPLHVDAQSPCASTFNPLALEIELCLPVNIHSAPNTLNLRLSIVTGTVGLPRLIERLKVKRIDTPVQQPTVTLRVESGGISCPGLCSVAVGGIVRSAIGRPSGLARPELDIRERTGFILHTT